MAAICYSGPIPAKFAQVVQDDTRFLICKFVTHNSKNKKVFHTKT